MIKRRTVESWVHHKYGNNSARIVRLIDTRKYLETNQIATIAMMPVKEARCRLYDMLAANVIQIKVRFLDDSMNVPKKFVNNWELFEKILRNFSENEQEVPRGTDRQPSKTIFLWYTDMNVMIQNLTTDTYKGLFNIK